MKKKTLIPLALCCALLALGLAGCPSEDDGKDDKGKVLKVTGMPTDKGIIAASLQGDLFGNEMIAVGLHSDGGFTLSEFNTAGEPDFSKPWNGSGEYYLVLATISQQSGITWWYSKGAAVAYGTTGITGPEKYDFTEDVTTIDWNQFGELSAPPAQP